MSFQQQQPPFSYNNAFPAAPPIGNAVTSPQAAVASDPLSRFMPPTLNGQHKPQQNGPPPPSTLPPALATQKANLAPPLQQQQRQPLLTNGTGSSAHSSRTASPLSQHINASYLPPSSTPNTQFAPPPSSFLPTAATQPTSALSSQPPLPPTSLTNGHQNTNINDLRTSMQNVSLTNGPSVAQQPPQMMNANRPVQAPHAFSPTSNAFGQQQQTTAAINSPISAPSSGQYAPNKAMVPPPTSTYSQPPQQQTQQPPLPTANFNGQRAPHQQQYAPHMPPQPPINQQYQPTQQQQQFKAPPMPGSQPPTALNQNLNSNIINNNQQPTMPPPTSNVFPPLPNQVQPTPATNATVGKRPMYPSQQPQQQPPPPVNQLQSPTNAYHQYANGPTAYQTQPQPQSTMQQPQYNQYNQQYQQQQLHQHPYGGGGGNVVQQGYNKLWGQDTVDLMQNRHILPPTRIEPPQVQLNHQFFESVNCNPE